MINYESFMKINNTIELKYDILEFSEHALDLESIFNIIYRGMVHYRKFDCNMFIDMNHRKSLTLNKFKYDNIDYRKIFKSPKKIILRQENWYSPEIFNFNNFEVSYEIIPIEDNEDYDVYIKYGYSTFLYEKYRIFGRNSINTPEYKNFKRVQKLKELDE